MRVTGLPQDQQGSLWLTNEIETGLFEVFARLGEVIEAMPSPMGMGGGNTPQEQMITDLAKATGVPDGKAVRFVSTENGSTATVTLVDLQPGPFPDDTFGAPAGYEKMQMLSLPRD